MDEVKQRMLLSDQQRHAIIHLDDHGVRDPAPLLIMDFDSWQAYHPVNFFNFFAKEGTVASFDQFKPAWQRYKLLRPAEAKELENIFIRHQGDVDNILKQKKLSLYFFDCYLQISALVDELDALVDRDLKSGDRWNHGYVFKRQNPRLSYLGRFVDSRQNIGYIDGVMANHSTINQFAEVAFMYVLLPDVVEEIS